MRPGAKQALVQAELSLPPGFWERLEDDDPALALRELAEDEDEVVLARRVPAEGRARAMIDGQAAPRDAVAGQPRAPEGPHRDGVDYVAVLMVERRGVRREGTTTVYAPDRRPLGCFTLAEPLDAALLIDPRVFHGVTAVEPLDPAAPGHRDVLVVTLRRQPSP